MTSEVARSERTSRAAFDIVFFDVDSTLVSIEGIDVLAAGRADVAALTAAAMNGDIPIDEVYARRLEMVRPTHAAIEFLAQQYIASTVPGAEETVRMLQAAGTRVHLVTAGVAQAVAPLAAHFAIPPRAVHAVELRFTERGDYVDFDRRSMLVQPRGKEIVVRDVRARSHGSAAFVGDGISDLETRPAVDLFIGFGGVHVRQKVKENAAVFVTDFPSMLQWLLVE